IIQVQSTSPKDVAVLPFLFAKASFRRKWQQPRAAVDDQESIIDLFVSNGLIANIIYQPYELGYDCPMLAEEHLQNPSACHRMETRTSFSFCTTVLREIGKALIRWKDTTIRR
ncbi:hypothetical protein PMAYCL1PPCAC_11608, partial [Pristionchus mayeri]